MGEWIEANDLIEVISPWAAQNLELFDIDGEETTPTTHAETAVRKAETYVRTYLKSRGKYPPPDEWITSLKDIALKRAIFEAYARVEQEEKAGDKREDAREMLLALLDGTLSGFERQGRAVIHVEEGRKDWRGYGS